MKHSWASYSRTVRNLVFDGQPPADLDALQVPVWLVAGLEDDVVDLEFLKMLATTHERVRVEVWPGGHDLPLSDPARTVDVIRRLISANAAPATAPKRSSWSLGVGE